MRDKNIRVFLDNLVQKANDYDTLEHMEKFYFSRDLKEAYSVLMSFRDLIKSSNTFKDKSSEKIRKQCTVLPDSSGKDVLYILGFLPLLIAIHEKDSLTKFFKKYINENKTDSELSDIEDAIQHQNEILFKSKFLRKTIPNDKHLVDHKLKNKKIAFEKERYENDRKETLEFAINEYCDVAMKNNCSREFFIKAGMVYWKDLNTQKSELEESFTKILTTFVESIEKKNLEKINKINLILEDEILNLGSKYYTESDTRLEVKVEITKDGIIDIKSNIEFEDGHKEDIQNIIMVKSEFELHWLRLIEESVSEGEATAYKYKFKSQLSLE